MRFTKGLGYGLAGVLLAGMLLATAISTAEGQVDDSSMTIPAAREGDEVIYVTFSDQPRAVTAHVSTEATVGGGLEPGPSSTMAEAPSGHPSSFGFTVAEITTMPDRTGMVHDVVRVDLGVPGDPANGQVLQYLDLATRDVIRADVAFEDASGDTSFRMRHATFGPNASDVLLLYGPDMFRYQGLTIRLGQDLTDVAEEDLAIYEHVEDADVLEHRTYVAERALVDGEDAYGIRTELRLQMSGPEKVSASIGTDGSQTSGESHTVTYEVDLVRTHWVTASSPYPVFIEETARGEYQGETREETSVYVLGSYEPGDRLVPWGEDRATEHYRSANQEAERERNEHPADGTGSSLGYGLNAAVQTVEDDPTLLNFQLWRQQNPSHRLVGAEFASFEDDAGLTHHQWRLVYAVPSGDAHAVLTERVDGVAAARNEDGGAQQVDSFAADDIPAEPLTLAAAERLWASVASQEYTDSGPNAVAWGLGVSHTTDDALGHIVFGYEQSESGFPATGVSQRSSLLRVDLATGNLVDYSEIEIDWEWGLLGASQPSVSKDPSIRTKTVPAGVQPPEVEAAALVTTSLLAVFLAAYFWPVLKYGAGAVFLGGYAKIKKDEVLDNEVRAQIHQAIQNDPGVNASEVGRRVDAGWGTVVYHLRVLEKNGYVSSLVDGRHKRFFPIGEVDWSKRGQIAALRNPKARTIYEAIAEDPGIIQGDLAHAADISVPAAIWHLKRLEDAGLVGREKKGRKVHYYANEAEEGRGPEAYDPDDAVEVA